ncbi:YlxR family protein [Pseudactinotalea sp. Z1748]|uniref:YlxR family protein n=1 Tax=Pseudactinotalea sp. Z1748 TaxID=3413027 RepID=UPI003C7C43C2
MGCRERAPRSDLVRLVRDRSIAAQAVIVDPAARVPGRGCWVHPHSGCLDRAVRKRAISRALRLSEPVVLDAVLEWFAAHEPLISRTESGSTHYGNPMSPQR